jgi:tripartite-type tricarboxylate transporter receptor subunit TctC
MKLLSRSTFAFAVASLCLASPGAFAETFPSRPVVMVVPYAGGGSSDK